MTEKGVLLGWLLVTVVVVVARVVVMCGCKLKLRVVPVVSLVVGILGSIFGFNFELNCRNANYLSVS